MAEFVLQSCLPAQYHAALERLVFFNPRQAVAHEAIARAVEAYGAPSIVATPDGLRVAVAQRDDVQCLFALKVQGRAPKLAGMVMYLRVSPEEVTVLHVGVSEPCSRGRRAGLEVVTVLIRAVRAAAHRLRGVRRLSMFYLQRRELELAAADGRGFTRIHTDLQG
jgi:hypothetical protein